MPFIGIISKENDCNFIKNEISKNQTLNKFEIININGKSIENIKNIRFDILVINEPIGEMLKNSKYLENIIERAYYIIVNSDIKNNILFFKNLKANIITYGFNAKATITVSSIKEENTMLCIQRSIKAVDGKSIEEQEKNIKIKKNNVKKIYNVLIIFTIFEIYGEISKKCCIICE